MPNQHVDDSVLSDLLSIDVPVLNTEPQMLLLHQKKTSFAMCMLIYVNDWRYAPGVQQ